MYTTLVISESLIAANNRDDNGNTPIREIRSGYAIRRALRDSMRNTQASDMTPTNNPDNKDI